MAASAVSLDHLRRRGGWFIAAALCGCGLVACQANTQGAIEITPAIANEGSVFFQHHYIDKEPPGGLDCCTDVLTLADVDGDGYTDVIVGAEHADGAGLVWYDFPHWQKHEIGRGQFTTDGEAVDFDADGDVDIVVGDVASGLVWFEQRSGKWLKHSITRGYTHDLVVSDLDGDGELDVVHTDKKRVAIAYRQNGGFRDAQVLGRAGEGLAVADLDRDGDGDIVFSNLWLENAGLMQEPRWISHDLAPQWPVDTRVVVADMNADGWEDVVLTGSEGEAGVSWFEAPERTATDEWRQHTIERGVLIGAHSLAVGDVDLDGDLDVITAEMHTSPAKRVLLYLQSRDGWKPVQIAAHGAHNAEMADLDRDGDLDLIGKNYGGVNRFVELWENRAADLRHVPSQIKSRAQGEAKADTIWTYRALDAVRPEYDRHTFGLVVGDVNSDGAPDLAAGGTLYVYNVEPAKPSAQQFDRITVAPGRDIIHMTPHRQFDMHSFLAVGEDWLELLEPQAPGGASWRETKLRRLPPGRTQGYASGPVAADGTYEFLFTKGNALFSLTVPPEARGNWRLIRVTSGVEEAGVAIADLDRDGDSDIVAVDASGRQLVWLESTPKGRKKHLLGAGLHWFDRVAIADLNNDERLDIVFTEETRDWEYNARVGWMEAPATGLHLDRWIARTVATLRSVNSLSVTDIDSDGDMDLVVAEHTDMYPGTVAADTFTGVFVNDGSGHWTVEPVEIGSHSSHLGARTVDLDRDGTPEIVSIGWEQDAVHLWRRAAPYTTRSAIAARTN